MIRVENVTKYYGAHRAVSDLNFQIAEGECVGFLGLNGAGKSTTLRILSCLLLPTAGRVTVRDLDIEENPHEIRKLIGYLPDHPPLYDEMTVDEYLRFAAHLRDVSTANVQGRIDEVVRTCSLEAVRHRVIGALSHGYRQRVGIAQAIVHQPALLILDEPIQGLDPVQIVEMRQMIRALRGKHTILLSTHILSEIAQTCDRILMMHEGRIAAEGSEDELGSRYRDSGEIEVEARGTEEKLRSILAGIADVQISHSETLEGGITRVRIRSAGDPREAISQAVVNAQMGLLSIRRVAGGLESIFVKLSQSQQGANASQPAAPDHAA